MHCINPIPFIPISWFMTLAIVHVFECVFYVILCIYAGPQKLVLLIFFLRSSGFSPLFFSLFLYFSLSEIAV